MDELKHVVDEIDQFLGGQSVSAAQLQADQQAENTANQTFENQLTATEVVPVNLSALPIDGQPAPGGGVYYQIRMGDNITSISVAKYGDTAHVSTIENDARNNGVVIDWDTLPTGIVIILP